MPFKENGTRINCRELVELQPEERMSQSKEKLTIPPDKVEVKRGQFLNPSRVWSTRNDQYF